MKLSIIIPTLNEKSHIENLIRDLLAMKPKEKEIFIVDGGSTDGIVEIVKKISKNNPKVQLLTNSEKYVSQGFNKAYPLTRGKYISLIGAHTNYPQDYFQIAIDYLGKNKADVVGGNLIHKGLGRTGETIANCMSSRFGVGGVSFRTSTKKQLVDTVPFAVYKREIFDKIGLFEESLIRNQDDELHYRIVENGFRILMIPEMETEYSVRNSLGKLFSQYFQYGYYKPLVLRKVKSGARIRHFLPLFFVLYLISLPISFLFSIWIVPIFFYFILNFAFSIFTQKNVSQFVISLVVYPVLHLSYGFGFLLGIIRVFKR